MTLSLQGNKDERIEQAVEELLAMVWEDTWSVDLRRLKNGFGVLRQYVIIGGTACDLLISDRGGEFQATRDSVAYG